MVTKTIQTFNHFEGTDLETQCNKGAFIIHKLPILQLLYLVHFNWYVIVDKQIIMKEQDGAVL